MKGYLNEVHKASVNATVKQKEAARKSAFELRATPFVYNAYLVLLACGAPTTESKVLAEAKKIAAANESHFAQRVATETEAA